MIKETIKRLSDATHIAIDFEAWTPKPLREFEVRKSRIIGIGLAIDEPEPWEVYFDFNPQTTDSTITEREVFDALKPIFENPDKLIVAHNAKFERTLLRMNNIDADGRYICTMMESILIDENTPHGLKDLVGRVFHRKRSKFKDTRKPGDLFGVDMGEYCKADSRDCLALHRYYKPKLEEQGLWDVLMSVFMPSVELASDMDIDGIRVDVDRLAELEGEYFDRMKELERQANEMLGHAINLSSNKEVSIALFEEIGIIPPAGLKKGSTGYYSTSSTVLKQVREQHDFPILVMNHRSVVKMLGSYIQPLRKKALEEDGRIRASWKPCMAETGRWRCANPNLQNLPRWQEPEKRVGFKGEELREVFIPEPGFTFISADYSQIELRLMAYWSGDANMLKIYRDGGDIHQLTADMCGCKRQQAKAVNFGCIYGMIPKTLREYIWLYTGEWPTHEEAEAIHNKYFTGYPGVKSYHKTVMRTVARNRYVTTITGRKRRLAPGQSPKDGFRELLNSTIQGSAADILGVAIRRLREELKKRGREDERWSKVNILLQVHDEIDLEAPDEIAEECAALVKECMERLQLSTPAGKPVPIIADVNLGKSWAEAK